VLDLLGGSVDLLLPLLGSTTKAEDQVESGLLLDVVVGEGAAVLKLLSGEDQTLLVRGNALLVCRILAEGSGRRARLPHTLNLGLDIVDGVRRLHLEGDSLTREGLDEDLHDGLDTVSNAPEEIRSWKAYLDNRVSSSVVSTEGCGKGNLGGANGPRIISVGGITKQPKWLRLSGGG
jgi:hypothetical protein